MTYDLHLDTPTHHNQNYNTALMPERKVDCPFTDRKRFRYATNGRPRKRCGQHDQRNEVVGGGGGLNAKGGRGGKEDRNEGGAGRKQQRSLSLSFGRFAAHEEFIASSSAPSAPKSVNERVGARSGCPIMSFNHREQRVF